MNKTVVQFAALVLLAIIGGAGGAGIAAYAVQQRPPAQEPTTGAANQAVARETMVASASPEPLPEPRMTDAAPTIRAVDPAPEPAAPVAEPSRFAALSLDAEAASLPGGVETAAPVGDTPDSALDPAGTASIAPLGEPVAVAETEEQIAALEARMAAQGAEAFVAPEPKPEPQAEIVAAAADPSPSADFSPDGKPLTAARAAKWVNLRAGPDNDAKVLAIVPAEADILAEESCRHWCAVVHDGRQGYIYKTFIARSGETADG